jgi:hypothetical protein
MFGRRQAIRPDQRSSMRRSKSQISVTEAWAARPTRTGIPKTNNSPRRIPPFARSSEMPDSGDPCR